MKKIKELRVNLLDSNTMYKFPSKFYDLFDLIFLLGLKVILVLVYWRLWSITRRISWISV